MHEETLQGDILTPVNATKLYSPNAIRIATFLGGPWITGYLIAENYKKLGQRDKVGITWVLTILATIVVFVIAYFLPLHTPGIFLPIVDSAIAYGIVKNIQGNQIALHIQNGGGMYSTWRAVGISFISLGIIVILWAVFFYYHGSVITE
jgi:hypothetical protein